LLSPKENKVQTSNDKNKTCRTATQRLWSVKARKTWQTNYHVFTVLLSNTKTLTKSVLNPKTRQCYNQIKWNLIWKN